MSTKSRPGVLHEQHRPFRGVWEPTVPFLACEPSAGQCFCGPASAAGQQGPPGLSRQPSCLPPAPDNTHSCSRSVPLHPLCRLSGRPVHTNPAQDPSLACACLRVLPPACPGACLGVWLCPSKTQGLRGRGCVCLQILALGQGPQGWG